MTKQKNIPQLRFPEFEGEWEEIKLSNVSTRITKKNVENKVKEVFTNSANIGIVSQRDYFDKDIANQNNLTGYYIVKKDNFVYNPRISNAAPVGPIKRNKLGDGVMSPLYTVFSFDKGCLDFFETYFNTTLWHSYLQGVANYGARYDRMNITVNDLFGLPLPFPTLSEQQKIASFFMAIDSKLDLLRKKRDLMEKYKKGVMQKLFSQEIRFKDSNGNNYADWEEKKLGEVGEIITGKTPNTADSNLWDGAIQFVTPTDITGHKYQITTERFITLQPRTKILPEKSILFTCIASIGKMSMSVKPCITNQQINTLVPNKDFDNEFIYYSLLNIKEFIKSTQSNSTLPIINKTEFSKFKIKVPRSRKEQEKIANFLSSIDTKIENLVIEIERFEKWKKGLLGRMFC